MTTLAEILPLERLSAELATLQVRGLTLDSRAVEPGDVFVALPGENHDGRDFIGPALEAGAVLVLAEAEGLRIKHDKVLPITYLAQQLGEIAAACYHTRADHALLLGVTGTNGKTSVTWFLRDALTALREPCALVGTLGINFRQTHLDSGRTTPDVLSLHRALADFRQQGAVACAMEVSSHALVQGRVDGVPIEVAVFTNLTRDHLDYHGTLENYFAAKTRLFLRPEVRLAVINVDDEHGRRLLPTLRAGVRPVTYGHDQSADVHPLAVAADSHGLELTLMVGREEVSARLPLYGDFNVMNVMAVVGVLHGLGHAGAAITKALAALTPVPGRMQPVVAAQGPRVLVDYAHTPDGLEKALAAVRSHFAGRLWCVVGCGGNRDKGKRPQMAALAEQLADRVVLTSDNPRHEEPDAILADMRAGLVHPEKVWMEVDRQLAVERTIHHANADDLVLLAGKGHETYQEIKGARHHLDDRELAAAALASWQPPAAGGGTCG